MKRVAYVCADPGVPIFGSKGCSVHVQEVVRSLRRTGLQVELFVRRLGGRPPADLEDLPTFVVEATSGSNVEDREQESIRAAQQLAQAVASRRNYDLVYERYSLWSADAMEFAHGREIPSLLEVNAPLIEEQAQHRGLVDRGAAEKIAARAFTTARAILAVSDGVADYLNRWPEASDRIHVIPNGVDPNRFDPAARSVPGAEAATVGFVGTLKPWHDLDTLIEAFRVLRSRIAGARLLIVGDGPARESLQATLTDWGLAEAVHFTGAVPPEEIPGWLTRMDIGVAPYANQTGFYFSPLKVVEYMAAALPTVASRIGALSHWIHEGETGLLVPPGDAPALATALEHLCRDPALRVQLGARARRQAEEQHTWDATVARSLAAAQGRA